MRDENTTSLAEIVTAAIITMMTAKQRQCEVMKACVCVCGDCSLLHGKLASSFARNWLAKKCALLSNTRHLAVAKNLAAFTWEKVCYVEVTLG